MKVVVLWNWHHGLNLQTDPEPLVSPSGLFTPLGGVASWPQSTEHVQSE